MGFLDDDSGDDHSSSDQLVTEQLETNKAELEAKKQSLFQTRLDIIKGQGGQSWVPNRDSPLSGKSGVDQSNLKGFRASDIPLSASDYNPGTNRKGFPI